MIFKNTMCRIGFTFTTKSLAFVFEQKAVQRFVASVVRVAHAFFASHFIAISKLKRHSTI